MSLIFDVHLGRRGRRSTTRCSTTLLCHGQEQLELQRQLLLAVEAVREVDPSNAAIGVQLHPEGLDIVCAVSATSEIGQVELNLVPTLIQTHGHGTDERFNPSGALVVGRSEASTHIFVVKDCDLESEVLLQILDDHHQERELDAQSLLGVSWASDEGCANVGAHDLENTGLNVSISQPLNVAIANLL
eukprot:CAMPEP_0195008026 /NCGR_PEP_ID=MMETSP0326_2-20130528/8132_1 /TAXON_ID=2866 ORGANISM="Crypthecodinium cohnii, Strain Seligo" /NCGR_SAMPLE_ID=MMETSP0326_2 /ASSEMBLY_ACC=CAM_ASM_000348 /LENGTH=187 /DNA_ID=CAMNT_0040015671 /DNA_START=36 /DNA_END=595 /DNA_ORIENTATION=+